MSKTPQLIVLDRDEIEKVEQLATEHEMTTQQIMNEAFSLGLSILIDEPILLQTATDSLCDPPQNLNDDEKKMYKTIAGMMYAAGGN